jgi:hypothetical protein
MVLSIICKVSAGPPPSARASSITSQIPLTVQLRNCRCTEFHLPSYAGRSRHRAPVRAIQKIASSTRRWSVGGRPPTAPGSARNGLKNPHSSSCINPRTNADLHPRSQRRITSHRVVGMPPSGLPTFPRVKALVPNFMSSHQSPHPGAEFQAISPESTPWCQVSCHLTKVHTLVPVLMASH